MEKQIVVDENGKIDIIGKWRIGELMAVAQNLMNYVNSLEVEMHPVRVENSQTGT